MIIYTSNKRLSYFLFYRSSISEILGPTFCNTCILFEEFVSALCTVISPNCFVLHSGVGVEKFVPDEGWDQNGLAGLHTLFKVAEQAALCLPLRAVIAACSAGVRRAGEAFGAGRRIWPPHATVPPGWAQRRAAAVSFTSGRTRPAD